MEKFLHEVARFALKNYGQRLGEVTVVFPNHRASLFFLRYLGEELSHPAFSPGLMTITEVVNSFSSLNLVDSNRLLVDLYDLFCAYSGSDETFDDFYFWGEMLLSDFNEIDKYLIDTQQLFRNIESLKEIDAGFDFLSKEQLNYLSSFWEHLLTSKNSDSKSGFLKIWQILHPVYHEFYKQLSDKGLAYEGMLYREMVKHLDDYHKTWAGKPVFLVGFNALNRCEKKLFNFFQKHCEVSFFWDTDSYYLDRINHEAGLFMRENIREFPMPADFISPDISFDRDRCIEVVSVAGNTGQSVYVSDWLSRNKTEVSNRFDNTAVVLCDEKIMLPVLQSLPDSITDVNITMGYPFKSSFVYGLIRILSDLDKNSRQDADRQYIFYYRQVLSLLGHPLVGRSLNFDLDRFTRELTTQNKIYLKASDFSQDLVLQHFFSLPDTAENCRAYLHQIIAVLMAGLPDEQLIDKETLHLLYQTINRLHDSLFERTDKPAHTVSKRLFYQLLLKQLDSLAIPFEGEPLKGLQLIGFLETRCLDFDHVLMLSASDNHLPGNSHRNSFIPYNLRRGFGLPLAEHRQAMYAYYFYRLLHRAKTVSLIFDSRSDGMSRGEVTRYVNQIKYEAHQARLNFKTATFGFEPATGNLIVVPKTGRVARNLETHLLSTVHSPTALNTYLDCSLRYFFRYIEKIREPEEMVEKIDNLMFGRVAHVALELLYQPKIGCLIDKDWIRQIINNKLLLAQVISKALDQEYFKGSTHRLSGGNRLANRMIEKYVLQILLSDLELAPFQLLALEKAYSAPVIVQSGQKDYMLYIGGTIDRIDRINDQIRIVDYKTGRSESEITQLSHLFGSTKRNKAAFQTMLYASCYFETEQCTEALIPAVYGARAVFSDEFSPYFTFNKQNLIFQSHREVFLEMLKTTLTELVDMNRPFEPTNDLSRCENCPYNVLCNRKS